MVRFGGAGGARDRVGAHMDQSAATKKELGTADTQRVMQLLPHRYPFLMVDRIIDMDRDESAIGIKNVSMNEPFFQGHFPSFPIMPGVLIIEGLAQTAGALCVSSFGTTYKPQLVYFMGIDRAKFRKPVLPGDQLHYHVRKVRSRGRAWRFHGEAKVNGQVVAEAEVSAMILDPEEYQKKDQ
jgi:3-hydroxyacyl-[acyl-carrier-protein] dehydratase